MKRFYKDGLITTLLGLGVLVFCGAMLWTAKSTAGELSGWLAVGLMFLRSKDSLIGLAKKEENEL